MDLDLQEATGSRVTHTATVPLMAEAFTGVAQPTGISESMDLIMAEARCTGMPERFLIITRAMADFITITVFLSAE
jgi:hypothetical protein